MRARVRFLLALVGFAVLHPLSGQARLVLRYSHPNAPESVAGQQAEFFARKVAEYSGGAIAVEVYPASRLGTLEEQTKMAAAGTIAFTHQTAATIGSLYPDFAVLDTPFVYRDVRHLLRVVDSSSPLMTRLSEGLARTQGLRVLYSFYFGTRQLTCDRPVRRPADLAGLCMRAIPFPVYELAVEGLGATPVPIDWSRTPVALAAGAVNGQENPVNIILSSKLYEHQSYLMLTGHIMSAAIVVVNEKVWRALPRASRGALGRAAREASEYATLATLEAEDRDIAALRAKGMIVIGPKEGLDREAFVSRTSAIVASRFDARWKSFLEMIAAAR